MKAFIFLLSLLLVNSSTSFSQCGKKVRLAASETIYLDSTGAVKRTVTENSVVQIDTAEVKIMVNDEQKGTCTIKSVTCNWTTPFKQGKTVIKGQFSEDDGQTKNVTIEIEGKDGKVILLFKMADRPDNVIKVVINKFEEQP